MNPSGSCEMAKPMSKTSRQQRWQKKKIANGLCEICGRGKLVTLSRCAKCMIKDRKQKRFRTGCKPWKPGSVGRPPLNKFGKPVKAARVIAAARVQADQIIKQAQARATLIFAK